jgi:hypothetical protein
MRDSRSRINNEPSRPEPEAAPASFRWIGLRLV